MTPFNTNVAHHLPTLVVDSNGNAAVQLAMQLTHRGFAAEVATSCHAARVAARARHFGTLVVIANLNLAIDRECLTSLRVVAPRTWIIISAPPHPDAQEVVLQLGADSLLITPFSVEELTLRLSAFSRRSRPL